VPGDFDNLFDDECARIVSGVLEVLPEGWGFLRRKHDIASRQDIYVAQAEISGAGLKTGDIIMGQVRPPKETEKYSVLMRIQSINGSRYSFL